MNNIEITKEHKEFLYNASLKQYKTLGSKTIHNGHSVFKYEIETGNVTLAGSTVKDNKIAIEYSPFHIYVTALNLKNASKKFDQILVEIDKAVKSGVFNKPLTEQDAFSTLQGVSKINSDKPKDT